MYIYTHTHTHTHAHTHTYREREREKDIEGVRESHTESQRYMSEIFRELKWL